MIHKRVLARENRRVQHALHMQNIRDMSQELKFWKSLGVPVGTMQEEKQWCELTRTEPRQELYVDRRLTLSCTSQGIPRCIEAVLRKGGKTIRLAV
jgi:hypothetical protein